MPLPALAIPIVLGLAKIGTAFATYNMNKSQVESARTEDKALAEVTRKDDLTEFNTQFKFANKRLNLDQQKLDYGQSIAEQSANIQNSSDVYESRKAGQKNIVSGLTVDPIKDESWLYKNRITGRY